MRLVVYTPPMARLPRFILPGQPTGYRIPVGQHYTGDMQNLFFVNDHDISNPTAQSVFSNIRIYEDNGSASGAGNSVYYIQTDHLNTARAITDTTNTVVWSWLSDPFGSTAANDDPDGDGSTFTYNLRFPGQYFDKETNLHYNYFRDYDPGTGRYVQSDPIGLVGGINTFSYVSSNPLRYFDYFGLHHSDIYSGVDTFWGAEVNVGIGGGLTVVTCQDECGEEREMAFAKVCIGLALNASGGGGFVTGLDGKDCNPDTYDEWFFETGVAFGYVGGSLDVGLPFSGLVEAGGAFGLGVQFGSFCYYIYLGDR